VQTHEAYIQAVAALATARLSPADRDALSNVKLVYGAGAKTGARGVTYYDRWRGQLGDGPLCEVCAMGQSGPLQLAGTTIHELGHALAGPGTGHGKQWRAACARLGLVGAQAVGQTYDLTSFAGDLAAAIETLPQPADGSPVTIFGDGAGGDGAKLKTCQAGVGARGGTSRGTGSGSRLRLWICDCEKPVKVRVASDDFEAHCDHCGEAFHQPEE